MYRYLMMRNDGRLLNVEKHLYINPDIKYIDESLEACEFLYKNTKNEQTKELIIEFINKWIYNNFIGKTLQEIIDNINSKPYRFLSIDFITNIYDKLNKSTHFTDYHIDDINTLLDYELNQEFIRISLNKPINEEKANAVFKISSINYDWIPYIYKFCAENINNIYLISIKFDDTSLDYENNYYYVYGNNFCIHNMWIEDFLEKCKYCHKIGYARDGSLEIYANSLLLGKSILETFSDLDLKRLYYKLMIYKQVEIETNCRKIT